jgi:proteasome lid subunit RPN8/RPN11
MKTTNQKIEASAPANVRPSSVSKTGKQTALVKHCANRQLSTEAVLNYLRQRLPNHYELAEVVGKWVWLDVSPTGKPALAKLLWTLDFHWNQRRGGWQHPCGKFDPLEPMNTTPVFSGMESLVKPFKFASSPHEYKVTALRECPTPESLQQCETPDKAADYWRLHIASQPHFNPDCECLAVLLLNTCKRVKGHQLVSIGTMDTILVHPREVFRLAIVTTANAVIVMHNHPSGESTPSEADIKVTRDLIRAGQLLKLKLLDHVVIGHGNFSSFARWANFTSEKFRG